MDPVHRGDLVLRVAAFSACPVAVAVVVGPCSMHEHAAPVLPHRPVGRHHQVVLGRKLSDITRAVLPVVLQRSEVQGSRRAGFRPSGAFSGSRKAA